jgi:hypothetical protein
MVHSGEAQLGVVEADRDAGAEQGGDRPFRFDRPAARVDVAGAALEVFRVVFDGPAWRGIPGMVQP